MATRFRKASGFSLHSFAASIFAGDSSLGVESMEMTETIMDSTVCTGSQRSDALS